MATTRKQRANRRRIGYFIAHCLAFGLLPQYLKVPVFAAASLIFCLLWIDCRRILEYWHQEFLAYGFLERASHVQKVLYPRTFYEEDILRKYIKEGLEKDEAGMKA